MNKRSFCPRSSGISALKQHLTLNFSPLATSSTPPTHPPTSAHLPRYAVSCSAQCRDYGHLLGNCTNPWVPWLTIVVKDTWQLMVPADERGDGGLGVRVGVWGGWVLVETEEWVCIWAETEMNECGWVETGMGKEEGWMWLRERERMRIQDGWIGCTKYGIWMKYRKNRYIMIIIK